MHTNVSNNIFNSKITKIGHWRVQLYCELYLHDTKNWNFHSKVNFVNNYLHKSNFNFIKFYLVLK